MGFPSVGLLLAINIICIIGMDKALIQLHFAYLFVRLSLLLLLLLLFGARLAIALQLWDSLWGGVTHKVVGRKTMLLAALMLVAGLYNESCLNLAKAKHVSWYLCHCLYQNVIAPAISVAVGSVAIRSKRIIPRHQRCRQERLKV